MLYDHSVKSHEQEFMCSVSDVISYFTWELKTKPRNSQDYMVILLYIW